jgi:hypothetical protein
MITQLNFAQETKEYFKLRPKDYVMVRPKYEDPTERNRGDAAKEKWWIYLNDKGFRKTLKTWEAILGFGKSVMVVADDPAKFDVQWALARQLDRDDPRTYRGEL